MSAARGDVVSLLGRRCDEVISAELERLRRRQPGLGTAELRVVEESLGGLVEALLIDPVRRHPGHGDAVDTLFALSDDSSRRGRS